MRLIPKLSQDYITSMHTPVITIQVNASQLQTVVTDKEKFNQECLQ